MYLSGKSTWQLRSIRQYYFYNFFCHSPDSPKLCFIRYEICVRLWWVYCTTANWPTKCTRPNNKNVLLYIWIYKSLRFSSQVFFRQNFDGPFLNIFFLIAFKRLPIFLVFVSHAFDRLFYKWEYKSPFPL